VNPVAGEAAVATVTVIGTHPGAIDLEWTIGNTVLQSGIGSQSFTPTVPGALAISVRGVARDTGEVRMASAVTQVRPQHGFSVVNRLADQLAKDELTQTIVFGFFIIAAGYAIFQSNWFGTFLDFLAAGLWGFSVNIGAAKVREIATPYSAGPFPFPRRSNKDNTGCAAWPTPAQTRQGQCFRCSRTPEDTEISLALPARPATPQRRCLRRYGFGSLA
jgi:hypothetical protein